MTENELLEKLYEGTLTAEEHRVLDARMAESPEFAAEVQEFLSVVQLLNTEKKEERADTAFLETTREKVIALIATAGAAGIAGGGAVTQSGGTSFLTAKFVQWAVVALGSLGVGGLVVWNVMDTPSEKAVSQPAVYQPLSPAPSQQPMAQQGVSGTENQTQQTPVDEPVINNDIAHLDRAGSESIADKPIIQSTIIMTPMLLCPAMSLQMSVTQTRKPTKWNWSTTINACGN
jgi:hypothetical protein